MIYVTPANVAKTVLVLDRAPDWSPGPGSLTRRTGLEQRTGPDRTC